MHAKTDAPTHEIDRRCAETKTDRVEIHGSKRQGHKGRETKAELTPNRNGSGLMG